MEVWEFIKDPRHCLSKSHFPGMHCFPGMLLTLCLLTYAMSSNKVHTLFFRLKSVGGTKHYVKINVVGVCLGGATHIPTIPICYISQRKN